uniref:AMP-dependent synthetase/ligase domain-containing protein n=1 Tax=Apteryx owenii TaxID=8824 RepID=A0A8B9Q9Z7_APTOW
MKGCKSRVDWQDTSHTRELCIWGQHVFMGYLNLPEQMWEALDDEGWLHTSDLCCIDQEGFIFITGCKKELLIASGGENVLPVPIEEALKAVLPLVQNAMLVGDWRKFLSTLLTLKCAVDPATGAPLDELSPAAVQLCRQLGSQARRVSEVLSTRDPAMYDAIQRGVDQVNRATTSDAQRVQKWLLPPRDFSFAGGELGPTLKLMRPAVLKTYHDEIEQLYRT